VRTLTALSLAALLAAGCKTTQKKDVEVEIGEVAFAPMEVKAFPEDRRPSSEAYRAALAAEHKLESGDAHGAIEQLEQAVLHDEKSAYLLVRLGELRVKVGDLSGARQAADKALKLDDDRLDALRLAALSSALSGQKKRARKTLRRALKVKPGDRDTSEFLAQLLLEDGRLKDAEKVIEAMMARSPGDIDGYVTLSRLYVDRGDVAAALRYVDKALERDERAADALDLKLDLLLAKGEFASSTPIVEALARERGDSPGMRQLLLTTRILGGDRAGADDLARGWLENDPSETTLTVVSGGYESAGARSEARRILDEHTAGALTGRLAIEAGRLAFDDHDYSTARRLLCGVRPDEGDPDWYAFARALCARATLLSGDANAAVASIREGLIHANDNWRLYSAWIWIARASDAISVEEPRASLERALKRGPPADELLDVASRAVEEAGDRKAARAILDDALRERAEDPARLMLLARFLERQGRGRDAVEIVERLMERGQPTLEMLNFAAFTLADISARPKAAERYAWRALLRGPLNGYVVDTVGWAQYRAGDVEAAAATLARADQLSPDEPEILFHRAEVAQARGTTEEARRLVIQALRLCPRFDPIFPRLRALAEELGVARGSSASL
jgi:tetratricopeptide (TPR) repeat protein